MSKSPTSRLILILLLVMSSSLTLILPSFIIPFANATSSTPSSSSLSAAPGFNGWNEKNTVCSRTSSQTCIPPDVQVAVSPAYVMEMVNSQRAVYTKQSVFVMNQSLPKFFNVSADLITDPALLFDSSSGRWFASGLDTITNTVIIAVSMTGDPTASWKAYPVSNQPSGLDQPTLGVNDDKVTVSANIGVMTHGAAEWWVYNKSDLVSGISAPRFQHFGGTSVQIDSIRPVQTLSSSTTEYMVSSGDSEHSSSSTAIYFFSISGVPGVGSGASVTNVSLPVPIIVQPPPDNVTVDDYRITSASWFMGKIWLGLNTACSAPMNKQVGCIRLVEIDTPTTTVLQSFDYSGVGQDFFYPALSIDSMGSLDLIYGYYSSSASSPVPGLAVTGQAVNDPVDTLIPSQTVNPGVTSSPPDADSRYGDYFGAAVDPSDPTLVWVAGEFVGGVSGTCLLQPPPSKVYGTCWNTYVTDMRVRVTVSINSSSTFLGFSVITNGSLTIDSALNALKASGAVSVYAKNATTGVTLFSKTYTVTSLSVESTTPGYRVRFLLSVGVNSCPSNASPCHLSSNNFITFSGTSASDNVGTTRNVDINQDGVVNQSDLNILNASYHCTVGQVCYNPQADLNGDGVVSIGDLSVETLYTTALDFM